MYLILIVIVASYLYNLIMAMKTDADSIPVDSALNELSRPWQFPAAVANLLSSGVLKTQANGIELWEQRNIDAHSPQEHIHLEKKVSKSSTKIICTVSSGQIPRLGPISIQCEKVHWKFDSKPAKTIYFNELQSNPQ